MKKTTKKRALVSSVAMLAVSAVAMGSATYAWFSQNTKATASGIKAQTTQSSNIVLSENGSVWTDKLVFSTYASGSMTPVTTADLSTWFTTTADAKNAGVKGTAGYSTPTANIDYTETNLYMKYEAAESTDTKDVKVTVTVTDKSAEGTSTDDFLRVALVPVDTTTKGIQADNVVWGTAEDDFAKDREAYNLTTPSTSAQTITTTTNNVMIPTMTLNANTAYHFKVYVWYEGTDPHCIDDKSVNNLQVDFEVADA